MPDRFVLRRDASNAVRYPAIDQFQPVAGMFLITALRKAKFKKSRVKQVAGIIAREGAAGQVGALKARREPDNQERRFYRPEGRDGRVEPAGVGGTVCLAKLYKTWAEAAVAVRFKKGTEKRSRPSGRFPHPFVLVVVIVAIIDVVDVIEVGMDGVMGDDRMTVVVMGMARDLVLKVAELDKPVSLTPQFVRHHREMSGRC